jgi:hypothetical protein
MSDGEITAAFSSYLRAIFGHKIKDILAKDLIMEADILKRNQRSLYDKAITR